MRRDVKLKCLNTVKVKILCSIAHNGMMCCDSFSLDSVLSIVQRLSIYVTLKETVFSQRIYKQHLSHSRKDFSFEVLELFPGHFSPWPAVVIVLQGVSTRQQYLIDCTLSIYYGMVWVIHTLTMIIIEGDLNVGETKN